MVLLLLLLPPFHVSLVIKRTPSYWCEVLVMLTSGFCVDQSYGSCCVLVNDVSAISSSRGSEKSSELCRPHTSIQQEPRVLLSEPRTPVRPVRFDLFFISLNGFCSCVFAMNLLLVAGLLVVCSGASEDGKSEKAKAIVGESVILPCQIAAGDSLPTVEWSKEDSKSSMALVYRDGCEIHQEKHPDFWYRTSLIMDELINGNTSLRISEVRLSDAGRYTCKMIHQQNQEVVQTVELFVGAVSQPKLWIVEAETWKVTLQCEASCWFPAPQITFLDHLGNKIESEDPKTVQDSRGGFNVTQRLILQTSVSRIVCRVHQPEINQTRVADIVPVNCKSSCIICIIITLATIITVGLCALAVFGCIKYRCCAVGQNLPSSQSTTRTNSESSLQPNDDIRETTSEKEKNKAISKPPQLPSGRFPSSNNPKPTASTSTKHPKSGSSAQNQHSEPLLPKKNASGSSTLSKHSISSPFRDCITAQPGSSSSASTSRQSHLPQPRTRFEPSPRPDVARPHLMYASYNRYDLLEHLGDDMDVDVK